MNGNGKMFFGGIPTEPDVKRLLAAFPEIVPDALIPYESVEKVLGTTRPTGRFRTITTAWRKRLEREQNFILVAVAGQGFRRLTEQDRSRMDTWRGVSHLRQFGRRTRDLCRVVTAAFSAQDLASHDHRTRCQLGLLEAARQTTKEIAAPAAPKQLPRAGQVA